MAKSDPGNWGAAGLPQLTALVEEMVKDFGARSMPSTIVHLAILRQMVAVEVAVHALVEQLRPLTKRGGP